MTDSQPLDRRQFLKGLIGGTAAFQIGFLPPLMQPPIALPEGAPVFNVRDFGALGDGVADDTGAILSTVDALNAAGGGSIYLPAGVYVVTQEIQLISNTQMYGDGIGATIITLPDALNHDVIGIVRTLDYETTPIVSNVLVRDLTIDGNRQNQSEGSQFGFYCGSKTPRRHFQITAWRVEVRNCKGYGFDPHEWTERMYILECISHGNERDGFTLDGIVDGVIRGCIAYNNDRHGFNIITNTFNTIVSQCIAHNNGVNGFTVQNGAYAIQITTSLAYSNEGDGIYCIGVNDNQITNNQIALNRENGIRIRGCARTTITGNRLRDNSQGEHDKFNEIILDDDDTLGTVDTAVIANHITCTGEVRARYGIRETEGEEDHLQMRNAFIANKVSGGATSDYGISGQDSFRDLGS